MSTETRNTLLHGQLQQGLLHRLMQAPAVSETQNYHELCLAVHNEEKRILELQRRQQYQWTLSNTPPESLKKRTLELPKGKTSGDVLQQATGNRTTKVLPVQQPRAHSSGLYIKTACCKRVSPLLGIYQAGYLSSGASA